MNPWFPLFKGTLQSLLGVTHPLQHLAVAPQRGYGWDWTTLHFVIFLPIECKCQKQVRAAWYSKLKPQVVSSAVHQELKPQVSLQRYTRPGPPQVPLLNNWVEMKPVVTFLILNDSWAASKTRLNQLRNHLSQLIWRTPLEQVVFGHALKEQNRDFSDPNPAVCCLQFAFSFPSPHENRLGNAKSGGPCLFPGRQKAG